MTAPAPAPIEVAKPGKYGTLHLFTLRYTDADDAACPVFEQRVWRYDVGHVLDAWNDSDDGTGWKLLSVKRVHPTKGAHRQPELLGDAR